MGLLSSLSHMHNSSQWLSLSMMVDMTQQLELQLVLELKLEPADLQYISQTRIYQQAEGNN